MRRSIPAAGVTVAGLIILADLAIANPALGGLAGWLTQLIVLLIAGVAVAGALALISRNGGRIIRGESRIGAGAVLVGMGLVLVPGLVGGPNGVDTPAVRWVVAALLAPLVAAIFALLFPLLLLAARRGLRLHGRETAVMLVGAAATLVLLLPIGGAVGDGLASVAGWVREVPIAAVFRGMLLGVAVMGALTAARILLGAERPSD